MKSTQTKITCIFYLMHRRKFNTSMLSAKSTRSSQGVSLLTLKKNRVLDHACALSESGITNLKRYRTRTIPATGALLRAEDDGEKQLSMLE